MGIFSSKYKTTVGTSVTRAIEDSNIPDSIRTGAIKSIMRGDEQMIENSMEELIGSIGVRADRMYAYGKKHYLYGLPIGTGLNTKNGRSMVETAIEEDFGPVDIEYYHQGPLNNLHFGWIKLIEQYQYNTVTNKLFFSGLWMHLSDMIVVVKETTINELSNGSLDQWGIPATAGATSTRSYTGNLAKHTPFEVDPNAVNDYLRIECSYPNLAGVEEKYSFTIPVSGLDETKDYHHVKYIKNNVPAYWLYRTDSGEHPGIDTLNDTEHSIGGSYFPWVYFRYNKKSMIDDKTSAEYKGSKKLVKYLGVDYDTVAIAINENPDIADVEQAILMMAVPANSTNQADIKYLYDYFNRIYQAEEIAQPNKPSEKIQDIKGLLNKFISSSNGKSALVIQDKKFKLSLNWRRVTKAKRIGYMGPVGTHQGGYGVFTESVDGFTVNGEPFVFNSDVKYHYYRRQITPNVYEEIRVEGLTSKYHIFEEYYETADENEDILLIPLDMAIVNTYSIPDREVLYARSLHYVFNSRVITKIKWYQRGAFKYLMIIIAIVITIWTMGASVGALYAAIISGSIAAIGAALITLAIELLIQFLIAIALKLFVKIVGGKFALIAALVIALYTGYTAIQAGSLSGAPFASELLSLSTGLSQAVQDNLKEDFNVLANEYEEFADMVKSQQEKLEKIKSELSYNNWLTPEIIFGETPNEYYDRTIHSGNIGVLAIDAISSYCDIKLSLPKLQETIGE